MSAGLPARDCAATREAVAERGECPLCGLPAADHRPEETSRWPDEPHGRPASARATRLEGRPGPAGEKDSEGSRASGSPSRFSDASLLRHAEEELAAALAESRRSAYGSALFLRPEMERLRALLAALREHHAELDAYTAEQEREGVSHNVEIVETELGLGSGGRYSDPQSPRCAGCDERISPADVPVWEAGAQWHRGCLPPGLAER